MNKKIEKKLQTNQHVSVVIPTFNGQNLLKTFLPDVLLALRNGDELIIVDDCSNDHTVSWLIKKFKLNLIKTTLNIEDFPPNYNPNVKQIDFKVYSNKISFRKSINISSEKLSEAPNANRKTLSSEKLKEVSNSGSKTFSIKLISQQLNLRFAATANVGVLLANNDHVLLLNNDVKPTKNIISQLLSNFSNENVFGVGCLEYEKDNSGEMSGKNKLWFSQGIFMHSKANNFISGETAWVSGGSGMFSRKKWLHLGGFDKLFYPAYWEDVDLSFRARKRGWKVLFDEKAVVFHVHESTNSDEFGKNKIDQMSWENNQKFVLKHGNCLQKILHQIFKPIWKLRRSR